MKVLVATARTQGQAPGDFCWVADGETAHTYRLGAVLRREDVTIWASMPEEQR